MKFAAPKSNHRSPRRTPGVLLFLFIGGLLCLFGFWSLSGGQKPKKPSFLEAEDRQLDHALHQKQDNFEIVVFYPEEPQEIVSTAKQQAEQLMTSLSTKNTEMPELPAAKQENPEPVLIKADYHTEILEQNTLSVVYLIQKKVGDQIEEDHWGYILDLQTGELITADQAFDQTGLDRISALFRDAMKNQEATHDLAYTLSFITASAPAAENFPSFYLEEDQLTFFVDIAAESLSEISSNEENILKTTSAMEKELRWSVDRNRLGSHFLLKPGVEEENLFIPPRTVDPQRPMVALTFDDGPHPKNTPRILETLKTYDGASTFFMVGTNVERYPDVVLQVAENGSEIASHTYNHPNLTRLSADSLNVQLNRVSELVNDLTHQQIQIQTLRPPYGAVDEQVKEASLTPLILWSLDTLDWKTRSAEKTVDLVLSQVEDGDIILMHDIHAESADAAETLIPKLTEMGFQLVTVQELMEAKGLEMLPGQKIFSANQDK